MKPLDAILQGRYVDALACRPLPLYYRFSPATGARMLHSGMSRFSMADGTTGHIWGIPFKVDADVPDGEVQLTRDFVTWENLP